MNGRSHQLHHIRRRTSPAMRASRQSLRHLFSTVQLAAGFIPSGGLWGDSQVRQNKIEVEESSWKILSV